MCPFLHYMSPFLQEISSSSLIFPHPLPTTDKQHCNTNCKHYKVLLCTLCNNLEIMYCIFRHSLQSKRSPYVELMTGHSCLISMPKPPDRSFLESENQTSESALKVVRSLRPADNDRIKSTLLETINAQNFHKHSRFRYATHVQI
jgi:hypothetical protein